MILWYWCIADDRLKLGAVGSQRLEGEIPRSRTLFEAFHRAEPGAVHGLERLTPIADEVLAPSKRQWLAHKVMGRDREAHEETLIAACGQLVVSDKLLRSWRGREEYALAKHNLCHVVNILWLWVKGLS